MNRKQRRQMSRELGIMQHQSKLPLRKKLDLIAKNIESGLIMQNEKRDEVQLSINEQLSEKESNANYSKAEFIAKRDNISLIDALNIINKTSNKN